MRELTSHKVNWLNEAIVIHALGPPGPGGACHEYAVGLRGALGDPIHKLCFQNGPIASQADINGSFSNEALLAIVEDRLLGFQSGEYACHENALALASIGNAIAWLHQRTRDRVARGVEGTLKK